MTAPRVWAAANNGPRQQRGLTRGTARGVHRAAPLLRARPGPGVPGPRPRGRRARLGHRGQPLPRRDRRASRSRTSATGGPRSRDAIAAQAARLPFAVGNIFGNEPALQLAAALSEITPGDLDRVHFCTGGSEAVEIALKLARQYHVERGEPGRDTFVSRWTRTTARRSAASRSVAASCAAQQVRAAAAREHAAHPRRRTSTAVRGRTGTPTRAGRLRPRSWRRRSCAPAPGRVAAFIAEPIVASVGGAIQPQPDYFPRVREICDRHGVLLIVDEVVTGFGRTGRNFGDRALRRRARHPRDGQGPQRRLRAAGGRRGAPARARARSPISARRSSTSSRSAATRCPRPRAWRSLDIWRRERLAERAAELAPAFAAALQPLREFEFVGDVRTIGLMAGIEFVATARRRRRSNRREGRRAACARRACATGS